MSSPLPSQESALSLAEVRRQAHAGDPAAQFELGCRYDSGYGLGERSRRQLAMRWFLKAANGGYAEAQNYLGEFYRDGRGVVKNLRTAVRWFLLAAQQGQPDAQLWLGCCYRDGEGVRRNRSLARHFITMAADQGEAKAKKELAVLDAVERGASRS